MSSAFLRFVSLLSVGAVLHGAAEAAPGYYYRQGGDPVTTAIPGKGTDFVPGTGALKVSGPVQVRARPGVYFSLQLAVQDAAGDVSWVASALPDGLSISPSGLVSGVPTAVGGVAGITATVTDSTGASGKTRPFTIDVRPLPAVTMAGDTGVTAGSALSLRPAATDVYGSQSWRVASGTLPIGVAFDVLTGALSGSPEQGGTFPDIRLAVSDADGATGVSAPFTLTVESNLTVGGLATAYQARSGRQMAQVRPYVGGGSGTYVWSLATGSGPLPPGVSLDPYGNGIGGKPTATGTWSNIAVKARDPASGAIVASAPFRMTVAGEPTLSVPETYTARAGSPVTIAPKATGLLGDGAWFLEGQVPSGLSFHPEYGVLGGYFGGAGSTQATTFRVVDLFDGAEARSNPFSTRILPRVSVAIPRYPALRTGVPATVPPPVVTGIQGTAKVSVVGTPPEGMAVDAATGAISGTPTTAGTSQLSYTVVDSYDGQRDTAGPFAMTVSPPSVPVPLAAIVPGATLWGKVGKPFAVSLLAQGNKGTVGWSLPGALPAGLAYDPSTGEIYGTPSAAGSSASLTATLTDVDGATASTDPFVVAVAAADLPSVSVGDMVASAGKAFASARPVVANGSGAATFELAGGTLPQGISLAGATGVLSGTTSTLGAYGGLVLRMADATGTTATTAPFTLTVQPAPGSNSVPSASLPSTLSGSLGAAFSAVPAAGGLAGAQTWVLASGALPSWARLSGTTGAITGTPDALGVSPGLVLSVSDATGAQVRTNAFSVSVASAPALGASIAANLRAPVGYAFGASPDVAGAVGAQGWTLAGTLPAGLSLVPQTGRIQGTPTAATEANGLVLTVTDASGAQASTQPFSISVPAQALTASLSQSTYAAHAGAALSTAPPIAANASGNVTWSVSPALPAGLALAPQTGVIGGAVQAPGTYGPFTLLATDADGKTASTGAFSVSILADPFVAAASSYTARQGFAFALSLKATNLIGAPTWSVASGALPDWASLDPATGAITGTPQVLGAPATLALRVVDGAGGAATSPSFSLGVGTSLTATPGAAASRARIDVPFASLAPTANGAYGAVTWSVAQGSALPPWLALDRQTGVLSGKPASVGTVSLALTATDVGGGKATTPSFSIVTAPAMTVNVASTTGRKGAPLSLTATVDGAYGAAQWSLASGTLPAGLALSGAGTISGRPTAAAPATALTLSVRDADGTVATSQPFTITVGSGIAVAGLPATLSARAGDPFQGPTLSATDAQGAVSWDAAGLPAGTHADSAGTISGTATQAGTYPVTVTATDSSDGAQATARTSFGVTSALRIVAPIPDVTVHAGSPFTSAAPTFVGQRGSGMEWSSVGAALPPGASVAPGTGIVSAPSTAAAATAYPGLVVQVRDPIDGRTAQSLPFAVRVLGAPYVTDVPTSYTARYSSALATSAPRVVDAIGAVAWDWAPGTAPPAWAKVDAATGSITGTVATFANTPNLALVARDATGATARSVAFALNVYSQPGVALSDTSSLKKLRVGDAYSLTPTPSGVAGAASWTLVADGGGALPQGLSVNPQTGVVSGTVQAPGLATFALQVRDSSDGAVASSQKVTLDARPALTMTGLQSNYTVRSGKFVQTDTPIMGGVQTSLSFGLTNLTLPAVGLTFDGVNGVIKGLTNGALAKRSVTLTATDAWDSRKATAVFDFGSLGPFAVGTPSSVVGRNGTDIALSAFTPPTPTNNVGTVAWSKAGGAWPDWLVLDAATGKLSGTPTGYASTATISGLTIRGTDSDGGTNESGAFSVTINAGMTAAISQAPYRVRSGGTFSGATPTTPVGRIGAVSWTLVTRSGTQPASAAVNANGVLTFKPTDAEIGTWVYALRATDASGGATADTQDVTATIVGVLSAAAPPSTSVRFTGSATSAAPVLTNLIGTASWQATSVPGVCRTNNYGTCVHGQGSSYSGSTGVVSVALDNTSPGAGATLTFVMKVTDSGDGSTATVNVPFTVTSRPTVATMPDVRARWGVPYTSEAIVLSNPRGPVTSQTWYSVDFPADAAYGYWYACANTYPSGVTLSQNRIVVNSTASSGYQTYSACVRAADTGDDAYLIYAQGVTVADQFAVSGAPAQNLTLTKGTAYSWPITATGAVSAITWTPTGALPPGLALASTSGTVRTLSGTPSAVGSYAYTLTAVDPWDGATRTIPLTITVVDAIGAAGQTDATTRVSADFATPAPTPPAGQAPYAWTLQAGALPSGTSLDGATGAIKGRPTTANAYAGIRLRATDANGAVADTNAFKVTVAANAMAITAPTGTQRFHVGTSRSVQGTATGTLNGTAPNWTARYVAGPSTVGGVNPSWLTLSGAGLLVGAPTGTGSATAYAVAVDPTDGAYASTTFTVQAVAALAFTTQPTGGNLTVGTAYTSTAPVAGVATGTVTYALMSGGADISDTLGNACAGLAFSKSTGVVSGTPTAGCSLTGLTEVATDSGDGTKATSNAFSITARIPGGSALFTVAGNATWTPPTQGMTVRYALMGGGSSGYDDGGVAGGGSGYLTVGTLTVDRASYAIVVGAGGAGTAGTTPNGGGASTLGTLSANGASGKNGGSGAAGRDTNNSGSSQVGGSGGGGGSGSGPGSGQGAWNLSQFTVRSLTAAPGGAAQSGTNGSCGAANTYYTGGSGGGGIYVGGAGGNATNGTNGTGGGNAGKGWGAGAGGAAFSNLSSNCKILGTSGAGSTGFVYVEWDAQ